MITIGQDAMFHHYGVTDKVLSHNSQIFVFMYYAPVNGMPHYPYMGPMWGKVGIVPFEFQ